MAASDSFAPELNQFAGRPRFNADPASLFEGGTVPDDWQRMEVGAASKTRGLSDGTEEGFDNEGNQYAKRPQFNSDPTLLFQGGTLPTGWMTATAAKAEDSTPTPTPGPTPTPAPTPDPTPTPTPDPTPEPTAGP